MRQSSAEAGGSTAKDVRPEAAKCSSRSAAVLIDAGLGQRPQLRAQRPRRRLQQRRDIDVMGAEADAELAQGAARFLVERLDLRLDALALQHAERLRHLEGDRARRFGRALRVGERDQRPEDFAQMGGEPQRQAAFGRLAAFRRQRLVGEQRRARLERAAPRR